MYQPLIEGYFNALHITPVLPTHFEQRRRDLSQRAHAHGVHQVRKHVLVVDCRLAQCGQRGRRGIGVARVEGLQALQL
jgi:hypothetical protein